MCSALFQRLELNTVDAPNEKAAETVTKRYMEPADLGPGIDPKVPRYIIPSSGCEFSVVVVVLLLESLSSFCMKFLSCIEV